MTDVQKRVQELLDELITTGAEQGLQVAIEIDGELVVDAWAGVADLATGRRVDGETLFPVFSVTKGITATVIHLLAERGLLDYDTPISHYWPEFGAHGKAAITLRQALLHRAGIPQMPEGVGPADICDWERMCRGIADLTPLCEPGTRTIYHALTFGWILGEVARRVDGRPFGQMIRDEICAPLGLTSLYLGIPDEVASRVATLESAPISEAEQAASEALLAATSSDPLSPLSLAMLSIPPALQPLSDLFNRPDVRRACIPAAGGIMNARSLARFYAALAVGEANSATLLSKEGIRQATTPQTTLIDSLAGTAVDFGLGYMLGGDTSPLGSRRTAFGHDGAGGSLGLADPALHLSFGLVKNRMISSVPGAATARRVLGEALTALGLTRQD